VRCASRLEMWALGMISSLISAPCFIAEDRVRREGAIGSRAESRTYD
jgi:hypothetical protein